MKQKDIEPIMQRINKFNLLSQRESRLQDCITAMHTISGDNSKVRIVDVLKISRRGVDDMALLYPELYDYDIKRAILPLLEARLEAIQKEMADL